MSSKKTPSNTFRDIHSYKIRRIIIVQSLQIKSLKRENDRLDNKIQRMEATNKGMYKFFFKLAYGCEVILRLICKPFRSSKK